MFINNHGTVFLQSIIFLLTYLEDPEGPGVHEQGDAPLPGGAPDALLHRLPVAVVDPLPLGHNVTVMNQSAISTGSDQPIRGQFLGHVTLYQLHSDGYYLYM